MWSLVAGFAIITLLGSHHVGTPLRDPRGAVFTSRALLSLAIFAVLVAHRWTPRRVVLALSGLLAYHVV